MQYRRNGSLEFHNPTEPYTNSCPLLPGQTVNVLEVPCLSESQSDSEHRKSLAHAQTLNPEDRFKRPVPPSSTSLSHIPTPGSSTTESLSLQRPKKAVSACSPDSSHFLTSVQQKAREEWLAESLGRLQTAVVDYCIATSAGHDTCDKPCSFSPRLPGRSICTAPGSCGSSLDSPALTGNQPEGLDKGRKQSRRSRRSRSKVSHGGLLSVSDDSGYQGAPKDFQNPFSNESSPAAHRWHTGGVFSLRRPKTLSSSYGCPESCRFGIDRSTPSVGEPSKSYEISHKPPRPASAPFQSRQRNVIPRLRSAIESSRRRQLLHLDGQGDTAKRNFSRDGQPTSKSKTEVWRQYLPMTGSQDASSRASPETSCFGSSQPESSHFGDRAKQSLPPLDPLNSPERHFPPSDSSGCDWNVLAHKGAKFDTRYSLWTPAATSPSDNLSNASARNSFSMNLESPDSTTKSPRGSPKKLDLSLSGMGSFRNSFRQSAVYEDASEADGLDHFASQETLKPATKRHIDHGKGLIHQEPNGKDDFSSYRLPCPTESTGDLSSLEEDLAARFGLQYRLSRAT